MLGSLADLSNPSPKAIEIIGLAANHFARSDDTQNAAELLAAISDADPRLIEAVVQGFVGGFSGDQKVEMSQATELRLEKMLSSVSPGIKGSLVKLATSWGSERFAKYGKEIRESLLEKVRDEDLSDAARLRGRKAVGGVPIE
jgi:uncharacterized protein